MVRKSRSLFAFALVIAMSAMPLAAQTVSWKPEKNVEIIVGSGAGGGIDGTARLLQRIWQTTNALPVTTTVINRPGGGGAISWVYVNQHPGDGHFVNVSPTNLITNRITGSHALNHTDVTALAMLFNEYASLAVRSDSQIKTAKDLVARLRTAPESVAIGLPSVGNVFHLGVARIMRLAGGDPRKLKVVVFKSPAESLAALLGGHIDLVPTAPANVISHVKSGTVHLVGLTSPTRLTGDLANVPTLREQGIDAVVTNWRAVVGPKGMTAAQVAYWDGIFAQTLRHEDWTRDIVRNLRDGNFLLSADTAKFFVAQNEEFRQALTDIGLAK
jgi:putative tricarboxylic transport membrane protein